MWSRPHMSDATASTSAAAGHTLARMDDVFASDLFAQGGALAHTLPGYEPREEQAELARAVADALASGEHLLAEVRRVVVGDVDR